MAERYANGTLEEKHVRASDLKGDEYRDFLGKAIELQSQVNPTQDNLNEANSRIKADLRERLTGNLAFEGQMPGSYSTAVRRELDRYKRLIAMKCATLVTIAKHIMQGWGKVEKAIGNDPQKGPYRIGSTLETVIAQIRTGGRAGDFVDPSSPTLH